MSQRFHDHFSAVWKLYASFRPHYPAALFEYLATLAVWDCAAGSGQATLDLAARFGRIIATDASSQQIDSAPPRQNVEYRVALAEQSGLPDQSIDLITVAQALHWFNLDRFFLEAYRVLKPGVGPYWPPERVLTETGYRTIAFPFSEIYPPSFRMDAHWTLSQLLGYFSTWSATNRFIKAKGHNPTEPLADALTQAWGDTNLPRLVVWPLSVRYKRA